jgi:hypothetical protein
VPTATHDQLNEFYRHLAESLDVPDSYREKAEHRYKSVGKWLDRDESCVRQYSPVVYPQGSFRLGTVVKPVSDADEYDLDLVCELQLTHRDVTQRELKEMVGIEVKSYATAQSMKSPVEEGRRCWILNYADGAQFHMDALPCIPDTDAVKMGLTQAGVPPRWAQTAIALTDRKAQNFQRYATEWPRGNPKGYGGWFASRMVVIQLEQKRELVALRKYARVEEVPDHAVKTPLQRVVQILKRHRDLAFAEDLEDRPISIIITTLCAHAYNGEADLFDALRNVVRGMPEHIQTREGRSWVPNPVNPLEDFADKWHEHPQREQKLRRWLARLAGDIDRFEALVNLHGGSEELGRAFGKRAVGEALKRVPSQSGSRPAGLVVGASRVPSRFDVPHREPPRWPVQAVSAVTITASVHRASDHIRLQALPPDAVVPKGMEICFEATTNVPRPCEVYWQVVNTGREAEDCGDLRGKLFADGLARRETTKYAGTHWTECFIVKNGVCVARSGEFVVRIG